MEFKDAKINHRYIVTKDGSDTTCLVGDIIRLNGDGSINSSAGGWIDANDVDSSTQGMEIELDVQYYLKKKASLEQELYFITKIIKEESK